MTAPIASGWSGCRVGLAPTGKRRLCTAHANNGSRVPALLSVGHSIKAQSERQFSGIMAQMPQVF